MKSVFGSMVPRWLSAIAAPVLVLLIKKSVRKDVATTSVLIDPVSIRYSFEVTLLKNTPEIVAAWAVPTPGSSEQSGETMVVESSGFLKRVFLIFGVFVICLGIFGDVFIEWISVDVPKSPVSKGSNGWLMFATVDIIPRIPESKKISIAHVILSFSFVINVIEIMIKSGAIICSSIPYVFGIIIIKSGVMISRLIIPNIDPISVSDTAVCPCLFFKNLCPARVLVAVSSSGAEK